jgi:hypothetical protein
MKVQLLSIKLLIFLLASYLDGSFTNPSATCITKHPVNKYQPTEIHGGSNKILKYSDLIMDHLKT